MLIECNAKINLGLSIVARRDDGYHDIETVFYPLPIYDSLELEPAAEPRFAMLNSDDYCPPDKNLVVRALRLLEKSHELPPLDIKLYKHIPSGAGLGGGSSDAAFTLKALNEMFSLGLSERELMDYASRLGADCAFFIRNTPVFADQKGDRFSPCDVSLRGLSFVLVKPPVSVSTAKAYSMVTPAAPAFDLRHIGSLPLPLWRDKVTNDFEKSVFPQFSQIAAVKQTLYDLGAAYASMSGSGSSVFGLFSRPISPAAAQPSFPGCKVFCGGFEE